MFKQGDDVKVKEGISYETLVNGEKYEVLTVNRQNHKELYSILLRDNTGSNSWFFAKDFEYYNPQNMAAPDKVTEKQIGGNHYQKMAIQPTEFIHKNNLSFLQGNVIKYISRYKQKNGLQDLQKAKHYIDLIMQFEYIDKE